MSDPYTLEGPEGGEADYVIHKTLLIPLLLIVPFLFIYSLIYSITLSKLVSNFILL